MKLVIRKKKRKTLRRGRVEVGEYALYSPRQFVQMRISGVLLLLNLDLWWGALIAAVRSISVSISGYRRHAEADNLCACNPALPLRNHRISGWPSRHVTAR